MTLFSKTIFNSHSLTLLSIKLFLIPFSDSSQSYFHSFLTKNFYPILSSDFLDRSSLGMLFIFSWLGRRFFIVKIIFCGFGYFTGRNYFDFFKLWGKGKAIWKIWTVRGDFDTKILMEAIWKKRTARIGNLDMLKHKNNR